MKILISAISLLLVATISAFGQQVSKSNPLGGKITTTFNSTELKVFVEVQFLREIDPALSVPAASISNVRVTLIDLTEKLANDSVKLSENQSLEFTLSPSQTDPMKKVLYLDASSASGIIKGDINKIPKSWDSFTYIVRCNVAEISIQTAVLSMQKINANVQNFTIKIDQPVWLKNLDDIRNSEIEVPITSVSASLVADIYLSQGVPGDSKNAILLVKGKPTPVKFNVKDFGAKPMEISVKLTEMDGVKVVLAGDRCTNAPSNTVCILTPIFKYNFEIKQSDSDLAPDKLKISSLAQPKIITVITTHTAKPSTMKAKLDGSAPVTLTGGSASFKLTLSVETLKGLKDGKHTLEFEGESIEGVKLAEKPFEFEKRTSPKLIGYPTFALENNSLKLSYELSGDVAESEPMLKYKNTIGNGVGNAGTFSGVNCVEKTESKMCSAVLTVSFLSLPENERNKPQIPVKLVISAKEQGSDSSKILEGSTFGFDLLNQGAIKQILDDIRIAWKRDHDDNKAKTSIAKSVYINAQVSDEQVRQAFDKYIREPDNSDRRKQWFQFFAGVGNFALQGFGVPIKIPTDL